MTKTIRLGKATMTFSVGERTWTITRDGKKTWKESAMQAKRRLDALKSFGWVEV